MVDTPKTSPNFNIREVPEFGINRVRIIAVSFLILSLAGVALWWGFLPREKKEVVVKEKPFIKESELVAKLPKDYSQVIIKKVKERVEVKKVDDSSLKARNSDLSFKMVGGSTGGMRSFPKLDLSKFETMKNGLNTSKIGSGIGEQDEKVKFLNTKNYDDEVLKNRVKEKASERLISAGTYIGGVFISAINSDLPGMILGQVSEDVYDTKLGKYLLIPKGTKLIGRYDSKVSYGQSRVLIKWERIIFSDGKSLNIENMPSVDSQGVSGAKDKVNNHYGKILSGVILGTLIGIGDEAINDLDQNYDGAFVNGMQSGSRVVNDAANQITNKNLNISPTIEIRAGKKFKVFVGKDLVMG